MEPRARWRSWEISPTGLLLQTKPLPRGKAGVRRSEEDQLVSLKVTLMWSDHLVLQNIPSAKPKVLGMDVYIPAFMEQKLIYMSGF